MKTEKGKYYLIEEFCRTEDDEKWVQATEDEKSWDWPEIKWLENGIAEHIPKACFKREAKEKDKKELIVLLL